MVAILSCSPLTRRIPARSGLAGYSFKAPAERSSRTAGPAAFTVLDEIAAAQRQALRGSPARYLPDGVEAIEARLPERLRRLESQLG